MLAGAKEPWDCRAGLGASRPFLAVVRRRASADRQPPLDLVPAEAVTACSNFGRSASIVSRRPRRCCDQPGSEQTAVMGRTAH